MKTILVPTDFSKNASNAIDYAISFAKKEKAKIILLHVYHITYTSPDVPLEYISEQINSTQIESNKILKAICVDVKKKNKLDCEFINEQGFAVDVILDTVKKRKIDMVVMGTKGASGVKEVFIGSITAEVVSKITCPIIVVPAKAEFNGLKTIAFATDYNASDMVTLKKLIEIVKPLKSEINLVHIAGVDYTKNTDANEDDYIKKFAKKIELKHEYKKIAYHLLYDEEVEVGIEKYIKKKKVDLLVMSSKERGFLERVFGKSITKKMTYHTSVPMLVFHHKSK